MLLSSKVIQKLLPDGFGFLETDRVLLVKLHLANGFFGFKLAGVSCLVPAKKSFDVLPLRSIQYENFLQQFIQFARESLSEIENKSKMIIF